MTERDRSFLMIAADLLEYPDERYFETADGIRRALLKMDSDEPTKAALRLIEGLEKLGGRRAREEYVAVFDHDPGASLHMAWHRYGNDRGQGRAMAALNGLYRSAGYEPTDSGAMPDYLPRMFEFLSLAENWAVEALLDGFGAEMDKLIKHLAELGSRYAPFLEAVVAPLRADYPELLRPRTTPDPTRRPMANPEPEEVPIELARQTWAVNRGDEPSDREPGRE